MVNDIIKEIKECKEEAKNTLDALYTKMELCHHYYNGKIQISKDNKTITSTNNIAPELNLIAKQIDGLVGTRVKTLTDLKAYPIEVDDEYIADLATRALKWIISNPNTNGQSYILQAHKDQLLGGIGWVVVDYDTSNDYVSGDIKISYERFKNVVFDPGTEDLLGLSDCSYIIRSKRMSKKDLKKLFPDKEDEIDGIKTDDESGSFFKRNKVVSDRKQHVSVEEYWYKRYVNKTYKINKEDETDIEEWVGEKEAQQIFLMNNPGYTFVDVTEPVIYVAISANDILLQDEKSSYKRFPFVPFVGYLDAAEEDWEYRLKGYANQLIGIQDQILFFRGAILKSVRDYSQQVIMVEDGALKNDDVSELVKVKSRSGVLRTKKGGNAGISWKEQSPIPQAYQGMELTLRNDLNVVGTPPEVMGTTGNLESGRAIGLMQSVGLVHTGEINEHLNFALRLLGQIILEIAFENFTQGKFQRICGKGFEILPQSLDLAKRFLSYDIKIDETTNSPTYRKAAFEEIIQAAQYIPGFSLPPEIVTEAMSLPYDIKQQFKEWQIKQQQMMMQQQQAQAMGAIQSNAALQPGAM